MLAYRNEPSPPETQSVMSIGDALRLRSEAKCELCRGIDDLAVVDVPPDRDGSPDRCVLICSSCVAALDHPAADAQRWRPLADTMWTPVPAVQVMAWRVLKRLPAESWAQDLLETLYLDEETRLWAEAMDQAPDDADHGGPALVHRDGNGTVLADGDAVTLIKDLKVKGAGFTAKRGTAVRNITLVRDNAGHIEGEVSGQQIVILTEFVKQSG